MNAPDPRQVEYVPLSELQADPRNPKAHDQDTIDASIGRFGVLDLIVRDERTGYLISGHGRHKALTGMEKRGESAPEGVKVDPDTGAWLVPVVTGWASRTDAEAGAALIALNRTTELGGWVDEALLDLLDDLSEMEDGLEGVGFTEEQTDDLRARLEELGEETVEEAWQDEGDGTQTVKTAKEYMDEYDQKARRMVVLDFPVDEFPGVVGRLKVLRAERGLDNNSDVVKALLEEACPELSSEDLEDGSAGDDSPAENIDPAATLEA